MKLNHIDLPVADIAGVRAFFESHFGFRCIFEREDGLTVLLDEALTLSSLVDGEKQRFPAGFHVGFNLQSEEALRRSHAELTSARVKFARPLGDLGDALTFQCYAPGGLVVELAWRPL
jgi:catechol 2,3-dioxygenase-like lactoylglutathione lyase family enzyme